MRHVWLAVVGGLLIASLAVAEGPNANRDAFWPQWRGPRGDGVGPLADPPAEWSETKNIRWKVELPGAGHSTPIVWGERVYVQTAVETDPATRRYQYILLALERATGKTAWQRVLCEAVPHEKGHEQSSPASNSPVTDGEHIYAYFGSRGLFCTDMQGQIVWQTDLGDMQTRREFGEGSSPALYGDTLVITWDHEGQSFIVALDKKTGQQRWKIDRDEPTSWATPVVVVADGKPQVVASATNKIRSYDLRSGELLWQCGGMTGNVIPTPVVADGLIYCISGFRGSALLAIRYADARGEIDGTPAVAWTYDGKGTPYIPSPVLYDGQLYFLQENRAALSCVDARTGVAHYARERLEGLKEVYASPVAAHGRVYVVDRDGKTAVIEHGPKLKILAVNALDESFAASPVVVDSELYLRGRRHLYCIAPPASR